MVSKFMTSLNEGKSDCFSNDIANHLEYLYSNKKKLSCLFAGKRMTKALLSSLDFNDKKVLDIGCGDGTYSIDHYDQAQMKKLVCIDPSKLAIEVARKKAGTRNITFEVGVAEKLRFSDNSFDIAYLRGTLHHVNRPDLVLKEAIRVSKTILLVEPNGNNLLLKFREKILSYHREHKEKSFFSWYLNKISSSVGGKIIYTNFFGIVPYFCSDGFARFANLIEGFVEKTPVIRAILCGFYIVVFVQQ